MISLLIGSSTIYSDELLLEYYKSRWDVEIFFKSIKYNTTFQNMNEKDVNMQYQKDYLCILIIEYISRLIELYWKSKNTLKPTNQIHLINRSLLINGIYNHLLKIIIRGELNDSSLQKFIRSYIEIHMNLEDRHFPRTSNKPFTKWYLKGYSDLTKYNLIIDSITNNTLDNLNKNLKVIAKNIVIQNG